MTAIITIVESPSMPGRFFFSIKAGRTVMKGHDAGREPSAAAAKAMELAICYGKEKGYSIFAPNKISELIPKNLRNGLPDVT